MTLQREPWAERARAPARPRHRARRARATPLRDPLLLAFMSAVLPGSGHLYAGRRKLGLFLLSLVAALLVTAAVVVLFVSHHRIVALSVRPDWLLGTMAAAAVGALLMVGIVLSAYRAGLPMRLPGARRFVTRALVGLLCLAVVSPALVVMSYAQTQRSLIGDVFADKEEAPGLLSGIFGREPPPDPWAGHDRLNVLLLGGDGKPTRDGVRTDSITVASIDTDTGRTVLLSLPRNLQQAPFPSGSPAAEQNPYGFSEFFFGIYRYGVENPELFPGVSDPGAAAMSAAVGETLGLTVHYYVLVNIAGFRDLVDALGGLKLRVEERLPIGGIAPDGSPAPVHAYVEPGLRTLDGYEALWYARSRAYSSDYDRMGRQRCVLGALARQADPLTVLRNFRGLASATKRMVSTNIPQSRLPDFVGLAGEVKGARISSVQFVPPMIDPADPDVRAIHERVDKALHAAGRTGGSAEAGDGAAAQAPDGDHKAQNRRSGPSTVEQVCTYE
ncbi:MAG: LCP family protein [Actinomycetes bacterium]